MLDRSVILLHDIVQVANRPASAAAAQFSAMPEFGNDLRIRRVPVYVDDPWPGMIQRTQCLLKEAFGCRCITIRREQKIDGVTGGITALYK